MAELILGIDIGTTSLKTAVFTSTGQKVASAIMEYSLLTPELNVVEAPCGIYMESIQACLAAMGQAGGVCLEDISTIGFSVQSETMLFLDEEGLPVRNAIVWMDNRAAEQAEQLRARFGDTIEIKVVSGTDFPDDLTSYDLIIHCGACMFNRTYMLSRIEKARAQGVPICNYGVTLAKLTGILDKVVHA